MKRTLSFIILAGVYCFAFSPEAKAEVTTITEVSYYEPTNSIFAWAEVTVDYETLAYYCFDTWGDVRKNDDQLTMFWGGSCENNWSYYEGFFPYDAEADYAIQANPQLQARRRLSIGDNYEDYYNYIQWTNGMTVRAPYYFGFAGPGPIMEIDFGSIFLGSVFSVFTQGGTSGPPHHLRVIFDSDVQRTDLCGQWQKLIRFQIVDSHNRRAGKVDIAEKPHTLTDPCSNTTVQMTTCSTSDVGTYGNFTDGLRTGCPHSGPSDCGFRLYNTWQWCIRHPSGASGRVDLARMDYDVNRLYIKVDGEADMTDLSYKFP